MKLFNAMLKQVLQETRNVSVNFKMAADAWKFLEGIAPLQ